MSVPNCERYPGGCGDCEAAERYRPEGASEGEWIYMISLVHEGRLNAVAVGEAGRDALTSLVNSQCSVKG